VLAGISNFAFKLAAVRGYNSELFSLYGGASSVVLVCGALLLLPQPLMFGSALSIIVFLAGTTAAVGGILKVYALRHIDSTIYFPLFKLLAPLLAIMAGVIWFEESFLWYEWLGMAVGLLVPLMLITKTENSRQNNLIAGLILIGVTGALSALSAVVFKYVIDAGMSTIVTLLYTVLGILVGSLASMLYTTGPASLQKTIAKHSSWPLFGTAIMRSTFIASSVWLMLYAFSVGGTLAVVQTIHSMYILIPIVLAIIFFNEHWNLQKVIAIVLSVASLALLG